MPANWVAGGPLPAAVNCFWAPPGVNAAIPGVNPLTLGFSLGSSLLSLPCDQITAPVSSCALSPGPFLTSSDLPTQWQYCLLLLLPGHLLLPFGLGLGSGFTGTWLLSYG